MRSLTDPGARWVLEKAGQVVQCRVDAAGGQPMICIELASHDSPVAIIQRCQEEGLAAAIETWREQFRDRGWRDSLTFHDS